MLPRRFHSCQDYTGSPQLTNSDSPLVVTQRAATLVKLVVPILPPTTLTHGTKPSQIGSMARMMTSMIAADPTEAVSIIKAMTVSGKVSEVENPVALSISG